MKKLLFLLVVACSCNNSPKVATTTNKTTTDSGTTATSVNKGNETYYTSIKEALLNPGKSDTLIIDPEKLTDGDKTKHLSADIGKLTWIKVLEIHCLENLEDLPVEIGNLKSLETLDMDEGNGCIMNVSIPSSIGNLTNLKELILNGALDADAIQRFDSDQVSSVQLKIKKLPETIANLQNLEELDLSRNGLKEIPTWVFSLKKLKILTLDANNISEIPSSISNLTNLEELSLWNNDISEVPSFISSLTNLKELSIVSSDSIKLPESLKVFKGLKLTIGGAFSENEIEDTAYERRVKERFPNIVFTFEDPRDYD